MIKKQLVLPGLLIGVAMLGGTTAYAFGPMGFDASALTSFTAAEQSAIKEAHEIRQSAHVKADALLEAAGVTRDEMHDAMKTYRAGHHEAMEEALESNNYDAFVVLMKDTPMAEKLTQETFAKMVEMHKRMESGDKEGAQAIRAELREDGLGLGFGGGMGKGMGGHHGMMHGENNDGD